MFITQARKGLNDWWRYLVMLLGILFAITVGQIPLYALMMAKSKDLSDPAEAMSKIDFTAMGIDTNLGFFLMLVPFAMGLLAMILTMPALHLRPFRSLITTFEKINWGKIGFAALVWGASGLVLEGIGYFSNPENYTLIFEWKQFAILFVIALLLLPLQTSLEEVFFRGYMMQGIGIASNTRWIPLLITSLVFGSLHFTNPEVAKFGYATMMPYYIGTGLMLGIVTLMDDSLELALGMHIANNFLGATLVTFQDSALKTPAIFLVNELDVSLLLPVAFAQACLFVFIMSKKYRWTNWKKIFEPLERQPIAQNGNNLNED